MSSSTETREFPLVSVDYFFLSDKGVLTRAESENKWDAPPESSLRVLAGVDGPTNTLIARAVPQKEVDSGGYDARGFADSIAWLGHSRVTVRSDNEPAIVKRLVATANLLKLEGVVFLRRA